MEKKYFFVYNKNTRRFSFRIYLLIKNILYKKNKSIIISILLLLPFLIFGLKEFNNKMDSINDLINIGNSVGRDVSASNQDFQEGKESILENFSDSYENIPKVLPFKR